MSSHFACFGDVGLTRRQETGADGDRVKYAIGGGQWRMIFRSDLRKGQNRLLGSERKRDDRQQVAELMRRMTRACDVTCWQLRADAIYSRYSADRAARKGSYKDNPHNQELFLRKYEWCWQWVAIYKLGQLEKSMGPSFTFCRKFSASLAIMENVKVNLSQRLSAFTNIKLVRQRVLICRHFCRMSKTSSNRI